MSIPRIRAAASMHIMVCTVVCGHVLSACGREPPAGSAHPAATVFGPDMQESAGAPAPVTAMALPSDPSSALHNAMMAGAGGATSAMSNAGMDAPTPAHNHDGMAGAGDVDPLAHASCRSAPTRATRC